MKPITFACTVTLPLPPECVTVRILDVGRWADFHGYGPVPGIRSAEFEVRTCEVVGSRIRVWNRDGSTHVEEVQEWVPGERVRLRMTDFGRPLNRLAAGFVETWTLRREGDATAVVRAFDLYPTGRVARPALRLIAFFLRRAVARHLEHLRAG